MKIRFDEHVAPKIVRALEELAVGHGTEVSSVLTDGKPGSSDVHWITAFRREGGEAIVSADKDFHRLEAQINAVFDTGMKVIYLPPKWQNATASFQTAHLLQWWDRIEACAKTMNQRECYQPIWNIKIDGKMKKVPINFQRAQAKRKRNSKRGR